MAVLSQVGTAQSQTLPNQSPHKTIGAVTCASSTCHGAVKPWADSPILQNEYLVFTRLDKHTRAYQVLFNEQSKRIAKNLELPTPAHEAPICLDCHGHNVPKSRHGERFTPAEGITCESCHGPAEKWTAPHVNSSGTPAAHHASNISNGLYPLNDPLARAKLCLSCHFGNKDRLVTHRIMGAGHPRMSFELDTFSDMQPRHFVVDDDYRARKRVWDSVQTWAAGQAIAVAETMDILLDDKRGRDGVFPELVLFDCHACHHPMSDGRWKPKSAFGNRVAPGLVRLNDSNMLMLRAVTASIDAKRGEQLREQMQKLNRAVAGDGDAKAEAANLRKMANDIAPLLAGTQYSPMLVQRVMATVIQEGQDGLYGDYAAAEQAYLALQSMAAFLTRQGAFAKAPGFNASMKKMNQLLVSDEKYQPQQFAAHMKEMQQWVSK